ncbi:MAG TPA: hypothetical protein VL244_02665 [Alphaproteobacteria bacterium]|nr:hypothetical protein [Alphaproteobacteria bacterium]
MRRRILGIIGRLLILAALVAGAAEVYGSFDRSAYHVVTASELLLRLSPGSLAFLQLNLPPELWETVLQPLLRLPAWLLLGGPGALMEYLHDTPHARSHRHTA